tara:strand:- start:1215 stop:2090 length:876 start_codon:yes stop_codon:yes gene_type:complete
MTIRTAVIVAAGLGTRFLPISKSVPKEMLPILDIPVIHYCATQAVDAGIETIVLVTSSGKAALEDYFSINPELEAFLESHNHPRLSEIKYISRVANIKVVRQIAPLGLGHAVLTAKSEIGNESFITYLPDEILIGTPSVTMQLLEAHERLGNVIGVFETPWNQVSRYGIVEGEKLSDRDTKLTRCIEKPAPEEAPTNLAFVGPYIFTPKIFDCLESIPPGSGGEIQLTDAIDSLISIEPVYTHRFQGKRYDAGTPVGLLKTSVELALQNPQYRAEILDWIQNLNLGIDNID